MNFVTTLMASHNTEGTYAFNKIVRSHGVHSIRRQELGQDIDSACGQLVVKNMKLPLGATAAAAAPLPRDIEDMVGGAASSGSAECDIGAVRAGRGKEGSSIRRREGATRTILHTAPTANVNGPSEGLLAAVGGMSGDGVVNSVTDVAATVPALPATKSASSATIALVDTRTRENRVMMAIVLIGFLYLVFRLVSKMQQQAGPA
jgi:hypothetical protein